MVTRPERCPLIPIPPHGRLIDADALKDTLDYYIREAGWSDEINEALTWARDEFIDHEPTIIEAEEVSDIFIAEINDMEIGCGLILIAIVALLWALCSFDPFDD